MLGTKEIPSQHFIFPLETDQRLAEHLSSQIKLTEAHTLDRLILQHSKLFALAHKRQMRALSINIIERLATEAPPAVVVAGNTSDPDTWGFAVRYRADVPWYLAVIAGRLSDYDNVETRFGNSSAIRLLYTKDVLRQESLDRFIADGLWLVQRLHGDRQWQPLRRVLDFLDSYLSPCVLATLDDILRTTNFFPTVSDMEQSLPFNIVRDQSVDGWLEVEQITANFFPLYHDEGLKDYWQKIRRDGRTHVWLAKSSLEPDNNKPTTLGVLVGGMHPLSDQPHLFFTAVLPDERRRGIASSLLRRFFAQTRHDSVSACTQMGPIHYHYEGAGLLKHFGATVKSKGKYNWLWDVPAPWKK